MTSTKNPNKDKNQGFDSTLEKLAALVDQMENADTSLEQSLKSFEEGMRLTNEAQKTLSDAEQKVNVLLEENGKMKTVDGDLV